MKVALVIGPDEQKNGQVVVKNLLNGEQTPVARDAVLRAVKELLSHA